LVFKLLSLVLFKDGGIFVLRECGTNVVSSLFKNEAIYTVASSKKRLILLVLFYKFKIKHNSTRKYW